MEAEILLAHVLQVPRPFLFSHDDFLLTNENWSQYRKLCQQRQQGEPIAYLLGYKEFWSLDFEVNANTLIPRPETELLVEITLNNLPKTGTFLIADLGTGSGVVAIAIAKERPHWQIVAADISPAAIEVAKRNVARHSLKNVALVQSDWCLALPAFRFDAIVSNPPYIAKDDPHLAQLQFEPQMALCSGEDGLQAIRRIVCQSRRFLQKNGLLLLEHGFDQADRVKEILQSANFDDIKSYRDISGIARVVSSHCR